MAMGHGCTAPDSMGQALGMGAVALPWAVAKYRVQTHES